MSGLIAAAGVAAAGTIAGGAMSSKGAKSAAKTQAASAAQAQDIQWKMFQQQQANLAPWIKAGTGALDTLTKGTANGGQFVRPFTMKDFTLDPGYAFQKQQGERAITAGAAARGMNLSPATIQALQGYNQGLASTAYQSAYDRFVQNQDRSLGAIQSLAGVGQSATGALNSASQTVATNAGNLIVGAGNATAAGQVGSSNAIGSAVSGAGQNILNAYLMSNMFKPGTPAAGTSI